MTADSRCNTLFLPWRVTSDVLAALCASMLIAPIVTIIDKSIILRTSTTHRLSTILHTSLLTALRHPHTFLVSSPYLLITMLYFATYTTANLTDTISSTISSKPANTVTAGPTKFLTTTTVNMSLSLYKDAKFARMFGTGALQDGAALAKAGKILGPANRRAIPKSSLALFALRDSLTIFTSFNVPPLLGPMIGSQNVAQFMAPAGVQLFSTPLHLLGLDLYNRPNGRLQEGQKVRLGDRWLRIRRDWVGAAMARMGRVIPAYGLGGVVNGGLRQRLLEGFEQKD